MRNIVNKTKASKKRFKALFKGIPIPTYSWQKIDDDLILIDYNDAADKLTKGMMKNYIGTKASEMYKNQPEILEDLHRCANDRVSIFREIKYGYMSTGVERFLSVMYGFIPPDLVIVHTEDITVKKEVLERLKKSEKELKALTLKLKQRIGMSEEKYRTIFENTGTATVIIEEDTTISLVNGQFEELSGYSREEIEWKKSWTEFVIEEDLESMKKLHYSRRKDPESTLRKYEFRFVNKEGNVRDILLVIDMIPGTKKSVASLLDITKRKKAEEKYRYLFDNAQVGLYWSRLSDGKILECNDTFAKIVGYDTREQSLASYVAAEHYIDANARSELLKEIPDNKEVKNYEIHVTKKDGTPIWLSISARKFEKENRIEGAAIDITERKNNEQKLKESEEKYREAYNRAEFYKDVFAHDINNILQSILSGTQISELILDNPEKLENLKINARIIKEQVIRGAKLVSNVRKLSQLEEAGKNLEKIEILNVLKRVISIVKKSYEDKNMAFQIDSVDENLFVKTNDFLEDVFENLLINAIRHNRNLIIEITVRISREQQNGINYLKMEFLDNGIGVDDFMKERIFKRAYSKEEIFLGMGLGLSLVRGIIETYNGKIWVEDRVKGDRSKGSNFVLLIPEVD